MSDRAFVYVALAGAVTLCWLCLLTGYVLKGWIWQ